MLNSKYLFLSRVCLTLRNLRQEDIPFGTEMKYIVQVISNQLKLKNKVIQDTGILNSKVRGIQL